MIRIVLVGMIAALATAASAQDVPGGSAGSAPSDEGGKAVDVGGLASRGGDALQSRRTFQETIRTEIYTPSGTSRCTPVQRPPDSERPQ